MTEHNSTRGPGRPIQEHAIVHRYVSTTRQYADVECRCGWAVRVFRGRGKRTASFVASEVYGEHQFANTKPVAA